MLIVGFWYGIALLLRQVVAMLLNFSQLNKKLLDRAPVKLANDVMRHDAQLSRAADLHRLFCRIC